MGTENYLPDTGMCFKLNEKGMELLGTYVGSLMKTGVVFKVVQDDVNVWVYLTGGY